MENPDVFMTFYV